MLALLFVFIASPFLVAAQTNSSFYQDGSSASATVREQWIRGYRGQTSDLQQKINALGGTANASVLMPVLFGVGIKDISPNFGDPRSGGRTHEGEDIMAVKGTPIVSPTPAVVIHTGVGVTEGNYVYTANPGGETFVYMHLDRIGEGVTVGLVLGQGSLIGYVGNTGNASGGAAHLHFEVHNSSSVPVDPFPRLTGELSLQEKISDLANILTQTSDSSALAQFLVLNFRSTFTAALAANVTLPALITNFLASMPNVPPPSGSGNSLPAGDLTLGSTGALVVTLQSYLIQAARGAAAARLALAGATGNFGPLTLTALVEYQTSVGISPASGYYGLATRTFIEAHPIGAPQPPPVSTTPGTGTATLTRNLYIGISGEDVRTLQRLLNDKGFLVSGTGAGSWGNETIYFGPATLAAVIRLQVARGIAPAAGYVGPITRASLVSL